MIANAQDRETSRLQKLDELLAVLDHCSPPEEADYVREHVQGARTYLLGAMPNEFNESMDLARGGMNRLEDSESRRTAESILSELNVRSVR